MDAWDLKDTFFADRPICWTFVLRRLPGAGLWNAWCGYEIPVPANDAQLESADTLDE
jgi:hypothetical protein